MHSPHKNSLILQYPLEGLDKYYPGEVLLLHECRWHNAPCLVKWTWPPLHILTYLQNFMCLCSLRSSLEDWDYFCTRNVMFLHKVRICGNDLL